MQLFRWKPADRRNRYDIDYNFYSIIFLFEENSLYYLLFRFVRKGWTMKLNLYDIRFRKELCTFYRILRTKLCYSVSFLLIMESICT